MGTHRVPARVLPVSPDGAVLLLHEQDPARPGELYWSSIGGAVDPGESLLTAAVRELREETGITIGAAHLYGPVHRDENEYSWAGVVYLGDHTYFAVPLGRDAVVSFDRLEPEEVGNVLDAGWWTPGDLLGGAEFRPPDLPETMRAAVASLEGES